MKPLLIGLNNPVRPERYFALYPWPAGCAGYRVWRALNLIRPTISRLDYVRRFDRCNLYGQTLPTGRLRRQRYRELALTMANWITHAEYTRVVLFGREVHDAFAPGLKTLPFEHIFLGPLRIEYFYAPHPSGRNPFYNDQDNVRGLGALLSRILEES